MNKPLPIIFKKYPNLEGKLPWIPILTNVPTPVERLTELEKELGLEEGKIFIKRDDKNHHVYGGNKLRKFEFIFAEALKRKKKGVMTFGGVGTNHGLACAIIAKEFDLKCDLFLAKQPLTWHVQRSLLLFDYFGAKIHYSDSYGAIALKGLIFRLFHPKYFMMLPGASLLKGKGSPLGTIGFINAFFELQEQIDKGIIPKPDAIFVACGSTGTAAGLIAGIKLLGSDIKVHAVAVSAEMFVNYESVKINANKTLEYLQKLDPSIPKVSVDKNDFIIVNGYLGSEYGVKTVRGQKAVDMVMELEGYKRGFKLETTYTGKAMAAMLDYLKEKENKSKIVLFWNTYNSNDLDEYLKKIGFNWKKLPKKLHKFYKGIKFQCWQIANCPKELRESCPAYLNHEYRFWKITECKHGPEMQEKLKKEIESLITLEDA
ncbi:MAG: 1-aminocyclopropane-1-carboxylate deaminase/D-cysteine desulfhydrase [Promethearchaeota archaeon]